MIQQQREKEVVLITGSSGLLGRRLVESLSANYRVIGLDVEAPEENAALTAFHDCDLTSDASVKEVLSQVRTNYGNSLAAVVHLAAYYDFSGEASELYQELTVEGTRRLLRELQTFGVGRFVFSSSLLVMKSAELTEIITEASPVSGEWDYPQSKIEAEEVLKSQRGEIPVTILRLAGVYDEGGHSPPITQQLARIYEKQFESFFFPGNSEHYQPFVHIDDAVDALRKAVDLRASLEPFSVYLIAEEDAPSYAALQEQMGELVHGKSWPTLPVPTPIAEAGAWIKEKVTSEEQFIKPWMVELADGHYPVSAKKAKEQLGWHPSHRLQDELPAIVDSLKADPAGFYAENKLVSDS